MARLAEKKQADVQALVDSEADFKRRLDDREREIAARLRAREEELGLKREETAEVEAVRRQRLDAIEYARTHDASAELSKTEHKQFVVAQAAERKRMQEAMRAEANRQKYTRKKQFVERMGRVTEWDRHKLLLQSEAKAAKTQAMLDTKKELQKQRRLLAIDFAFKKEQLKENMSAGATSSGQASSPGESGGKSIQPQASRSFGSGGSM
eukprot:SAG22_NODE_1122_length_5500_cov_2.968339_2_plen_209_part_00